IVAEAIRASMSIPFFFKAWQFSNNVSDKQIYVDGGVVFNYPLSFFDNVRFNTYKNVNYDSIGLYLYAKNKSVKTKLSYSTPLHFTKKLFESLMDTQDFLMNEDPEQMQRSIMIDDLNIPATDFQISKDDMKRLVDSGNLAAKKYLKTMNKNNEDAIIA
ncbi:MAG: patatin-like phospholipase family protein, partial [Fimbriimonadaceae bacterium]|nr:patatin-like phospholipase family protein [Chitinophagales bacterium]